MKDNDRHKLWPKPDNVINGRSRLQNRSKFLFGKFYKKIHAMTISGPITTIDESQYDLYKLFVYFAHNIIQTSRD